MARHMRKELLGVVAVDSGHLVVADPSYVCDRQLWRRRGSEDCVDFWGVDAERFRVLLKELRELEAERAGGCYRVRLRGKTARRRLRPWPT